MSKKFTVIVADPPWNFKDSLSMSDVARGAQANYSTMTISKIKGLPVNTLADPNGSVLALWIPSSLLQEGLDTMKAWGFNHKQTYVWVKVKKTAFGEDFKRAKKDLKETFKFLTTDGWKKKALTSHIRDYSLSYAGRFTFLVGRLSEILSFGMGRLFRQTHEICLIGTNNNKIYKKLLNKSQRSVSFGENLKHSAKPEHLQESLELMFPNQNYLELFARRIRPGWTCLGNEICNGEDITVSIAKL